MVRRGGLLWPLAAAHSDGADAGPEEDPEPTIQFLAELSRRACEINTGVRLPRRELLADDLSLQLEPSGDGE